MIRTGFYRAVLCWSAGLMTAAGITADAAAAEFAFRDGILRLTSARYDLTWQQGSLVQLTTRLPQPQELTVTAAPMTVGLLPNGPGSFHGNEKAGFEQHRVIWGHDLTKGPPTFPAQHPPEAGTAVTCEKIRDGVRLVYRGLQNDPGGVLIQELTVDRKSGELLIRQRATSAEPGLFGIAFSLLNLRPDLTFAVPYFGGQRFGGNQDRNHVSGYAWPQFWNAGLVIGEIPAGGAFLVFADDAHLAPKYLRLYNSDAAQGLGFEANAEWPYAERREVTVCTWRFNTYAGGWQAAARRYKEWLAAAFALQPRAQRPSGWVDDIALVWPGSLDPAAQQVMAQKIPPKNVLVLDLGWAKGFNRHAPYYQPGHPKLAEAVQAAHESGFRYGVYTAHKLIDRHAWPNLIELYDLKYAFDGLSQTPAVLDTLRDEEKQVRQVAEDAKGSFLAGIHPGSKGWIDCYAEAMTGFHRKYGIDLFYQDVTGANCGSSGLIDGLSLHEGTVACERRIRERLPQVAAAGEFWTEVNVAAGQDFGLSSYASWFNKEHHRRLARYPHPFLGAIFNDYCRYISYRTPIRETEKFHWDQNQLEVMGALPVWTATAAAATAEARLILERARLFAAGYQPYYPDRWAPDAAAYLRDAKGRLVVYRRDGDSTFCWRETPQGRTLVYARIHGQRRLHLPEPALIEEWPAYDPDGLIGLDPERWYCVFPGTPPARLVTLTELPPQVTICGVRTTAAYCLVELNGTGTGRVRWSATAPLTAAPAAGTDAVEIKAPTALLFGFKPALAVQAGDKLTLESWNLVRTANGLVTGPGEWLMKPQAWSLGAQKCFGYMVYPESGGENTEIAIDGHLKLPADKNLALSFSMGRLGGAGDGVNYVVRVNGRQVWKAFSGPDRRDWVPVTVPLGAFAGQEVILSLALDAGPSGFNLSNDQSLWGDPKIIPVD